MKMSIVFFLLMVLFGITISESIAQQNQIVPKTVTEVEKLKIQLKTLENEKIGLETKLAEANARLINTDVEKLKGDLRKSNNDWLRSWNNWFIGIVSVIAVIIGAALLLVLKTLIERAIEKRLDGFKESVDKVSILEDQIKILEKEHAASMLEDFVGGTLTVLDWHPERIKALSEEALLEVFSDKTRDLTIRFTAIEVLAARKSPLLVAPVLNFLNSVVDSDADRKTFSKPNRYSSLFLSRLSEIHNEDTYQGLKKFLNRLMKENPKNKDLFLSWTVFSLTEVSIELETRDSVKMLKEIIPDLIELKPKNVILTTLAEYFDKFKEPEGIEDILKHIGSTNSDVGKKCLNLLEKHDPDFVREQRKEKATYDVESKETDESMETG